MAWVDVEVHLDDFDNDELIKEIEDRGYKVIDEDDEYASLTSEECKWIRELILSSNLMPHTPAANNIYEKLLKR